MVADRRRTMTDQEQDALREQPEAEIGESGWELFRLAQLQIKNILTKPQLRPHHVAMLSELQQLSDRYAAQAKAPLEFDILD